MSQSDTREIAFFGKITAGITHELKNVLAIIGESSGLMEDIMSLSPEALISYQEKFKTSLSKIKNQIKRGVELTDRLNKFAHSSDEITAKVDLNTIIEQFVALSQRFARLKNIILKADLTERPQRQSFLITYPVQLQMALFAAIECCLSTMPADGAIRIGFVQSEQRYDVHVLCEGNLPSQSEFIANLTAFDNWPVLQKIASNLGGSATLSESDFGVLISLPEALSA